MTNELMEQVAKELAEDFRKNGFMIAEWQPDEQTFSIQFENRHSGGIECEEYNLTELFENFSTVWLSAETKERLAKQ